MKTVLIITSSTEKIVPWKEREQYVSEFCAAVESHLTKIKVRFTTYDRLEFSVREGVAKILDTKNDIDLKDAHFVQFKNWTFETEEAPTMASYLKLNSVPFANTDVDVPIASGKLSQMFRLGENGVPVPDTFYARKARLKAIFASGTLPEGFELPLIMKATTASRGKDNYLVRSVEEALDILEQTDHEKEFVLQNFIENDGDYRILFQGLDETPIVFHRKGAEGSHLNNTSQGGVSQLLKAKDLPPEYISHARKAAEVLRREIGGVDIIVDKRTQRAYVLEVNGTPALATGHHIELKTKKFAEFIEQMLEVQEEEEE